MIKYYRNLDEAYNITSKDKVYVAIIGTRLAKENEHYDYIRLKLYEVLRSKNLNKDDIILISGGAKGVDKIGESIAKNDNIDMIVVYPDYMKYEPKVAPLERNKVIAKVANIMLAFPRKHVEWSGTHHAIKQFKDVYKKNMLYIYPIEINDR